MSQYNNSNGSSTMVIELQPQQQQQPGSDQSHTVILDTQPIETQRVNSQQEDDAEHRQTDMGEAPSVPPTAVPSLQKWNGSRENVWRLLATFVSFMLIGANDASYGVSHSIIRYDSYIKNSPNIDKVTLQALIPYV